MIPLNTTEHILFMIYLAEVELLWGKDVLDAYASCWVRNFIVLVKLEIDSI